MYIIIPSAKIVPEELTNLGKLPAIIYPVNQKIVFSYLYEQHKEESFRVVAYENAETIHKRLAQYQNTEIIDLDKLGDLGYTVYKGISGLKGEAIINFGDTIVFDSLPTLDSFFYARDIVSDKWTFFAESNGEITQIIDKQKDESDQNGKLFVGVFKFSKIEYFSKCLLDALNEKDKFPDKKMSSFYSAIMKYSKDFPLTPTFTSNWLDIGHADRYFNSQIEVKAREFNHIKIDKDRGILTKYSDNVDKFIGEIKWYLKLPKKIEYVRPRIFDYSLSYTKPFVSMEYYAYHTVHELFLYGDLNREQWIDIFKRIKFVISEFKQYTVTGPDIQAALKNMYLTKTIQRFEKMKENKKFLPFFKNNIKVNGKTYISLEEITHLLQEKIPEYLFDINYFTIIHGDLCFANIMVDNNLSFIKLIDPRGKFGPYDIYGDYRYELAKLFHSVDGKYDFIIKDLFDVNYSFEVPSITYSINNRKQNYELFEVFKEVFSDEIQGQFDNIQFIEALLFLSMIPLHGENIKHQIVMLATGLDILNRVIDIEFKSEDNN